jgi:hypothetical protein
MKFKPNLSIKYSYSDNMNMNHGYDVSLFKK